MSESRLVPQTALQDDIEVTNDDLIAAAQTSLVFWDNPFDDQDWNDA